MSRKHVWSHEDDMVSIDLEERVGVATPPRWNLQIRVDQIGVYDS